MIKLRIIGLDEDIMNDRIENYRIGWRYYEWLNWEL